MIIMTNATALAASDARSTHETALSKSIARLSSGKKIINPADDAAGLKKLSAEVVLWSRFLD